MVGVHRGWDLAVVSQGLENDGAVDDGDDGDDKGGEMLRVVVSQEGRSLWMLRGRLLTMVVVCMIIDECTAGMVGRV